jgi:hypothetical protein
MDEPNQPAEPTTEAKRSRGIAGYVVWGFGIVVVYLLSAGPIAKADEKRMFSPSMREVVFSYVYAPWTWAYVHTPLRKPLGMYLHVWVPSQFDRQGEPITKIVY